MKAYNGVERRSGKDRRQNRLPLLRRLFFKGQRVSSRRTEDRRRIVAFDRYNTSLLISVVIVLGLSLLDAMLTLTLLSKGAKELNPVMDYYLSHGPGVFLTVKYGLTALSVSIIVLLKNVLSNGCRLGTSTLLHLFAAGFGSAVIWQCYLLAI
jgi:hypothetical protein